MLVQQFKQKMFFSFFLLFWWTPHPEKNVSSIKPCSHAGFIIVAVVASSPISFTITLPTPTYVFSLLIPSPHFFFFYCILLGKRQPCFFYNRVLVLAILEGRGDWKALIRTLVYKQRRREGVGGSNEKIENYICLGAVRWWWWFMAGRQSALLHVPFLLAEKPSVPFLLILTYFFIFFFFLIFLSFLLASLDERWGSLLKLNNFTK